MTVPLIWRKKKKSQLPIYQHVSSHSETFDTKVKKRIYVCVFMYMPIR